MKTLLLLTMMFFVNVQLLLGQNENEIDYRFAKEAFKSENYKRNNYPRFDREVTKIDEGVFKFGKKYLTIELERPEYEKIFKLGIFNPDIVFGKETYSKTKAELDTLSQKQKVFYNFIKNDSLSICCVEELKKINPNPQTKRFIFWLFRIGIANPTEYYFELYNENATKRTSFEEFIENARMTFFYAGTIII
jgi:hypothetical protein